MLIRTKLLAIEKTFKLESLIFKPSPTNGTFLVEKPKIELLFPEETSKFIGDEVIDINGDLWMKKIIIVN
jgi:hypothetical protein